MRLVVAALFLACLVAAVPSAAAELPTGCEPVGRLGNVCLTYDAGNYCATGSANANNASACHSFYAAGTEVCSSATTALLGTCIHSYELAECTLLMGCSFVGGAMTCSVYAAAPAFGVGCAFPTMTCTATTNPFGIDRPGLKVGGESCQGGAFVDPTQL